MAKIDKERMPEDVRVTLAMGLHTRDEFIRQQMFNAEKMLRHEDVEYWKRAAQEVGEARDWLGGQP